MKLTETETSRQAEWEKDAQSKLDNMVKPVGSLGKLEDAFVKLATIFQGDVPTTLKKIIVLMGGDHGVSEEGVSAAPKAVTTFMMHQYLQGKATINSFCASTDTHLAIIDVGVDCDEPFADTIWTKETSFTFETNGTAISRIARGTNNMTQGAALTHEQVNEAISRGKAIVASLVEQGYQLIGLGEMGISNSTIATAISTVLLKSTENLVGIGTGVDVHKKANVINQAIQVNTPNPDDPIDVLAKVGGLEIAGLVGIILGCAEHRIPVVIDGVITAAAAIAAFRMSQESKLFMLGSHKSATEPSQVAVYEEIGLDTLLELKFRLGEGTGAVLAMDLYEAMVHAVYEVGELPKF